MKLLLLLLIVAQVVWGQYDPNCGGKTVIVHLFEWKWNDVAAECERFLGPTGYCGVQVSPPTEHIFIDGTFPWWQRYQPVSYKLFSRSGTEAEFVDMVRRCNVAGVRIYVDAIFNHMTGGDRVGTSPYANSPYDGGRFDYPAVPYNSSHFTPRSKCPSATGGVDNYQDPNNIRNCELVGLRDLNGNSSDVQDKVAAYLNRLVDIGVAGIRVDAAKHMWPQDIAAILAKVKPLNTDHGFPANSKLFIYQEVIDFNNEAIKAAEYFNNGYVMEFRYSRKMAEGIFDYSLLYNLVDVAWNMSPTNRAFVFVDNHDSQRDNYGVGDVITFKTPSEYMQATAYMLAHPYGLPMVMSSYNFTDRDAGPPGTDGVTDDVVINADGSCGNGWICEHRWKPIANMVRFNSFSAGTNITKYWNNGESVAFSREGRCFFAMSKFANLDRLLQTGLPEGTYCNLINDCTTTISVDVDGNAQVVINNPDEPFVAICVGDATTLEPPTSTTASTTQTTPMSGDMKRTVVFIQKSSAGKEVFIRGGIDHEHIPSCTFDVMSSQCAIPISVKSLGTEVYYSSYNAWSAGDSKLDWYGPEPGQGTFLGIPASGTPLVKTSNDPNDPGYQPLNQFGDDYWMVDMWMDCSKTWNGSGWFELRAFLGNEWESAIEQSARCAGNPGGSAPFKSTHHIGRCGYLNLFYFESNSCEIEEIEAPPTDSTVTTTQATTTSSTEPTTQVTTQTTEITTTSTTEATTTTTEATTTSTTEATTTVSTTTQSPPMHTIVFVQTLTVNGEFVFIRGGNRDSTDCQTDPESCTIPIEVNFLKNVTGHTTYNTWRENDTKLDWIGAEPNQGGEYVLNNVPLRALGTPLVWSTNDMGNPLYLDINTFGPDYWIVNLSMDCSATNNGWFAFRSIYLFPNGDDDQETLGTQGLCTGNVTTELHPFGDGYHAGRCGFMNVFHYGQTRCEIYTLN